MPIHLLSPEIASQIAAGEVVERPASVVKELVENALDAGAGSIVVNIEAAGRVLIQVADNGAGIPADELPLAVERHATSKLSNADDLFHIATLGFRGEALASIGSVSRMTITSRTTDSLSGVRLVVEGGSLGRTKKVGAPTGTEVRVEDLFYNVPARLKFLKQDSTERRAIDALITRYALAYPAVRFKLVEGETSSLQTSGDGDRRAILAALYGVDTAHQMLELQADEADYQLSGYISPTALTRSNRKEITFFVNGRWVQDVSLTTAVLQAYRTLLMVGRYPMAILFIQVPPEEVDVNVHPAKAEVRFRHPDQAFSFVQHSVRKTVLAYTPVPQVIPPSEWAAPSRTVDPAWSLGHTPEFPPAGNSQISEGQALGVILPPLPETSAGSHEQTLIPNLPLLRLIGQVGATYLVAEGPDGLYLIDQHAAHERVLFEKLMAQHERKSIASQALLTPAVVHLPPEGAKLLADQLPILQDLGFQVDPFGPASFQVRAIPILFSGSDPSAALQAVIEDFEEDETPLQTELEARLAARVCKRMAVKAGKALSPDEQRALLNDLEACNSPRTCPHGRPTMIHLSVDLLERQFGRKGPHR